MFSNSTLKLAQSIENLRQDLQIVARNSERIDQLEKALNELSSRVASFPQPLRANWIRHTAPAWERETINLPAVKRVSSHLTLLPPPPARQIARVTICMSGSEQFVHAYDSDGQEIRYLSGPFREVGLRVLEAAGDTPWEEVFESA